VSTALRGWFVAAMVYFFAVFNRSSLGVAGLIAEERFHIGPGALSTFVLLQVGVYAAMQIPTGLLVDRYGPRRLLIVAAAILGVAQLGFAFAQVFVVALLARALLGCGDALTFVSVLRFTGTHFSPRRFPLLVALTAFLGTVGNVAATVPLTALLDGPGWTPAFFTAAVGSFVAAILVVLLVRDPTPMPRPIPRDRMRATGRAIRVRIRTAWAVPGTRMGFWVHFSCMACATPLAVLWGVPYLVEGAGFSTAEASTLLLVAVLVSGLAGPAFGAVIGRWPASRIPIGLGVCAVTIGLVVLLVAAFGDDPPAWAVAPTFVIVLLGGPASMAAFAVVRDYNAGHTLGTASGVVNVGGFVATVIGAVAFGVVLDLQGGADPHAMRLALLVLVAVQAFGAVRLGVWYRRMRADVRRRQRAGETVPVRVGRRRWFDVRELEEPVLTA
jgi:MFS family permease